MNITEARGRALVEKDRTPDDWPSDMRELLAFNFALTAYHMLEQGVRLLAPDYARSGDVFSWRALSEDGRPFGNGVRVDLEAVT